MHRMYAANVRRLLLGMLLTAVIAGVEAAQRDRLTGARILDTTVIESLSLAAPTQSATATVRITFPTGRGRFPIVVLSQGARSTPAMYGRLAEHWAARGHVVIQPVPPELSPIASGAGEAASPRLPATVESRIADIRFVLGALEQIEARARPVRGRLDRDRIAVVGHSTGALATLFAAGPKLSYLDATAFDAQPEPAIDAVVLIGDPSRSGIVPDAAWRSLEKPTLLATGTHDEGELSAVGTRPAMMFALGASARPAPRHELFVRGMDVCLGGLLCRVPAGTTPDLAALAAVADVTTAFLQAHLASHAAAAKWLREEVPPDLANGRARLKVHP